MKKIFNALAVGLIIPLSVITLGWLFISFVAWNYWPSSADDRSAVFFVVRLVFAICFTAGFLGVLFQED